MGFQREIAAGRQGRLVPEAIQSETWDGDTVADATDTTGWRIERDGAASFNDLRARATLIGGELHVPGVPDSGLHVYPDGLTEIGEPGASRLELDPEGARLDDARITLRPAAPGLSDPQIRLQWAAGNGQVSLDPGVDDVADPQVTVAALGATAPGVAQGYLSATDPAGPASSVTARSDGEARVAFTKGFALTRRAHSRTAVVAAAIPANGVWTVIPLVANAVGDAACPELADNGNGIQNVSGRTLWTIVLARGAWGTNLSIAGLRGYTAAVNGAPLPFGDIVPWGVGAGLNHQHGPAVPATLAPGDIVTLVGYCSGLGVAQSAGPGGVLLSVNIVSD